MAMYHLPPLIVDTNVLFSDIKHVVERGRAGRLTNAGQTRWAAMLAAAHVEHEVDTRLAGFCSNVRIDYAEAVAAWRDVVCPEVRFVDVGNLVLSDPRITYVQERDADDAPTAMLAVLTAPSVLLTKDKVLLDAFTVEATVPAIALGVDRYCNLETTGQGMALAGGLTTELGKAVGRAVTKHLGRDLALFVGAVAVIAVAVVFNKKMEDGLSEGAKDALLSLGSGFQNAVTEGQAAHSYLWECAVSPEEEASVLARVAHAVSTFPDGCTVSEIVERIGEEHPLHRADIEDALCAPIFSQDENGRLMLGRVVQPSPSVELVEAPSA